MPSSVREWMRGSEAAGQINARISLPSCYLPLCTDDDRFPSYFLPI